MWEGEGGGGIYYCLNKRSNLKLIFLFLFIFFTRYIRKMFASQLGDKNLFFS